MRPTRPLLLLAAALTAASLAGCTATAAPKPVASTAAPDGAAVNGADLPVAAFAGASGTLLGHLGNGKSLQWLQVTDVATAYGVVSDGTAKAALAGPAPKGWKATGQPVESVGVVYSAADAFYSRSITSADAVEAGATVVLPKEKARLATALGLLADADLILLDGSGKSLDHVTDSNGLDLVRRSDAKTVDALEDAALVFVSADSPALAALTDEDRPVLIEPEADRERVSLIVRKGDAESAATQAFYEQLTSADSVAWLAKALPGALAATG